MFNLAYSDTLEDDQADARSRERDAYVRAIELIDESSANKISAALRSEAIHFNVRMWSFFMEDLAKPENECTTEFKAGFISIGIFVLKHLQAMREDTHLAFDPVREINESILQGLEGNNENLPAAE